MMGLLSAQVAGKRAIFEASQRSLAVDLARDMVERMRANSVQLAAYQVDGLGGEDNPAQSPDTDCAKSGCSAVQLATFDVWQWELLLQGAAAQDATGNTAGLLEPRGCISTYEGHVKVTISWRSAMHEGPTSVHSCTGTIAAATSSGGVSGLRQELALTTFITPRL
jgi:type IV pilus assembly protein PilV